MAGWMVTVAVIREEDEIGHEMYAVAIDDATQAMDAALKAAGGEAAVLNGQMDEASMKSAGLETGGILKILDNKCAPPDLSRETSLISHLSSAQAR